MNDYRILLKDEFSQRVRRNPGYSLRAFARDLAVSPAFLTLVFSGKKRLSEERAHTICERMPWDGAKRKLFTQLVRLDRAKGSKMRDDILAAISNLKGRTTRFTPLKLDLFQRIAEWQYYAILELTAVRGFRLNARTASEKLGTDPQATREAISRLKRLGLLTSVSGNLRKSTENYATFDMPSRALRQFHKQMLTKAGEAIETQSLDERDFSGITMAIDPKLIPRARAMVREFANELMELLETGDRTEVYQFSTQLFRLTKGVP